MKHSSRKGFSFGLTSGVITTVGLTVGLDSTTGSSLIIIGGILTIAIADALSDALGIHISEESEGIHSKKEIWNATIITFISKFFFALTFIVPILLLPLSLAVIASVIWALILITGFSFIMAKRQGVNAFAVVAEHLSITALVIFMTHYIGDLVKIIK